MTDWLLFIGALLLVLALIREWRQAMATLSEAVEKLEADAAIVQQTIADLKQIIASLKDIAATPDIMARLEKIDADLDAATAPDAPPAP